MYADEVDCLKLLFIYSFIYLAFENDKTLIHFDTKCDFRSNFFWCTQMNEIAINFTGDKINGLSVLRMVMSHLCAVFKLVI